MTNSTHMSPDGRSLGSPISGGCASLYLCAQLCQEYAAETNSSSQLHTSCTNKSVPRLLCCAVKRHTAVLAPRHAALAW